MHVPSARSTNPSPDQHSCSRTHPAHSSPPGEDAQSTSRQAFILINADNGNRRELGGESKDLTIWRNSSASPERTRPLLLARPLALCRPTVFCSRDSAPTPALHLYRSILWLLMNVMKRSPAVSVEVIYVATVIDVFGVAVLAKVDLARLPCTPAPHARTPAELVVAQQTVTDVVGGVIPGISHIARFSPVASTMRRDCAIRRGCVGALNALLYFTQSR
ncbi:hypothetical protein FA95DRAFT_503359 [Auriscalpium vulgare]|uniref:Uncharacterized protein n=1 Tax=Auriscalpium vulgare TaxID=40419 RepID=A0ACB8RGG8_9AGAM|nr:hypothetical protein FA95DRAFT_503359 [Auriscalpium vulgare]